MNAVIVAFHDATTQFAHRGKAVCVEVMIAIERMGMPPGRYPGVSEIARHVGDISLSDSRRALAEAERRRRLSPAPGQ